MASSAAERALKVIALGMNDGLSMRLGRRDQLIIHCRKSGMFQDALGYGQPDLLRHQSPPRMVRQNLQAVPQRVVYNTPLHDCADRQLVDIFRRRRTVVQWSVPEIIPAIVALPYLAH